jgi:UDPglucose 6-dehydrogenase
MKIGLIGVGMVGTQVKDWFERNGDKIFVYDKDKGLGSMIEVNQADIIFVCVPTPYSGDEYDLSILEEVISNIDDNKTVVIKSTVNPGTTDYFQQKYPNKVFMFNPEFLTEATARNDFFNPDMQILGVPHQGYALANEILSLLPRAPYTSIVSPVDAEWIKKIRNAFYSVKVIFFNEIFDIMNTCGMGDYETVRNIFTKDKMIGDSHSIIYHKGLRGFGGKCLPKDTYSLIDFARKMGRPSELLEVVKKINYKLNNGKK